MLGGLLILDTVFTLSLARHGTYSCSRVSAANVSLKRTGVGAGYEQEARYFEDSVRHTKQCELAERAQLLLHSAFSQQLGHLRQSTLRNLNADMISRDPQQSFSAAAARYGQPLQQLSQWCVHWSICTLKRGTIHCLPSHSTQSASGWSHLRSSEWHRAVRVPTLPVQKPSESPERLPRGRAGPSCQGHTLGCAAAGVRHSCRDRCPP